MASDSLLTSDLASSPVPSSAKAKEQFLRFQLVSELTALLPVSQLAEVLTIPVGQITPIPHLPAWVMGAYNWRGEVLWMIDLAHLIGFTPWHQQGMSVTYTAVVLHIRSMSTLDTNAGNQMIGLVINRAEMMLWCEPDLFQSPSSEVGDPQLVPFLRGYQLQSNGEQLAVLDDEVIIAKISQS